MPREAPSPTKTWRKTGIVERAVAPSICGATGTSRQPRTVRPSSCAIVSMRETASSVPSTGRKAMPTAYAPASGSSNPATSRKNASGTWERMPAPSPESGSEPVAPRCSRLRSTVSAWSTRVWDASPVRVATKPTPHASCSLRGSYIPCAAGRASMKDQFWPLTECWDGWRGVRIGSPVVVIWHVASAEGRRWPSAVGASVAEKFGAGYMMDWFSVNGTICSSMRTPTGCGGGSTPAVEAMETGADRSMPVGPGSGRSVVARSARARQASLPAALTAHARRLRARNQRVTATYAALRISSSRTILRPFRTGCPGDTSHRPPRRRGRAAAGRCTTSCGP